MGWFDEQIRQRKDNDKDVFSEALFDIVGAVSGKKFFVNINDNILFIITFLLNYNLTIIL